MSTNSRNNGTRRNNGRNRNKPILTFQSKGYYQILVGNYGVEKLCREVHSRFLSDYLNSYSDSDSDSDYEYKKEHFKKNGPSVDQLIYIVLICHFYRCYKLSVLLGYYLELDMQMLELQRRLEYIKLPAILCDYIESIGRFQLKNGITVVPWFAPAADFYAPELAQLHPLEVLNRAGRSQCIQHIFIDINWLDSHVWCLFKTSNKQLKMRKISWDELNGNIKMIMTTKVMNENEQSQHITIPQTCLEEEAERGLIYNFRRFSEQAKWPADTLKVCQNFISSCTHNDHFGLYLFDIVASTSGYINSNNSHEILVGNYGVEQLCKIVHISIYSFHWCDPTLDQLIYVMLMCHSLRCYDINFQNDEDIDELKIFLSLELPSILCKYIETIGSIDLKNGIHVIPWCGSREEEFYSPNLGQLTPKEVLERAGRPVPENKWCIDYEWIKDFRNRIHRIDQTSPSWLQLRKIDWDNKKGGIEMIVSTKVDLEQTVIATAPQSCLEVEAQRGAVFNYRRFSEQSHWPKDTSLICQDYFRARKFIPVNVLKSFYQN